MNSERAAIDGRGLAALFLVASISAVTGCKKNPEILLRYQLKGVERPADIYKIETIIDVDPSDGRQFFVDQQYVSLSQGIGYQVGDFDQSGKRSVLIRHDATLGFTMSPGFTFRLLPATEGQSPPLKVHATGYGANNLTIAATMDTVPAQFAVGATVDVVLNELRCGQKLCDAGEECCGSTCANTATSDTNCGTCGHACAGAEKCVGGTCRCAGGTACTGTATCFDVGCLDLQNDPFNCGARDHACNPGEMCQAGTCRCGGGTGCGVGVPCCGSTMCSTALDRSCSCGALSCAPPNTCCGGSSCVNLMTDNANCGMCGRACTAGTTCGSGACKCRGAICGVGTTCCAAGCADLMNDAANCGACGYACAKGEKCLGGKCQCGTVPAPFFCNPATETCCGFGTMNAVCANLTSDPKHCSSCTTVCSANEKCVNSACSCEGGGDCGAGNQCCAGQGCLPSAQVCGQPTCTAQNCTNGNTCVNNLCQCGGGAACTGAQMCCTPDGGAGYCSNTCFVSSCGICNAPNSCCNFTCTPPDVNNCGGCNMPCPPCYACSVSGSSAFCTPLTIADGGVSTMSACP